MNPNQNQTLETAQLANMNTNTNTNQNTFSGNFTPQTNQPYGTQINPIINPQINPNINVSPNIVVNNETKLPPIEIKPQRTIMRAPIKVGTQPLTMQCPFCNEKIQTRINKTTNMKALLTAIGLCYCGFAGMQACNNKEVGCDDCEHECPSCGYKVGNYYAM